MLLIASLLIAGFAAALIINNNGQNQADYYVKQLGQLKTEVQLIDTLNSSIYPERKLSNNIDRYQGTLINMADRCQKMSKQYKIIKKDQKLKELVQKAETADKLCKELTGVTEYALSQSLGTERFILFPAASIEQNTDNAELTQLQTVLRSTQTNLEKLKTDEIKDPALSEQLTLLKGLQSQTDIAAADRTKSKELSKSLRIRQGNFLNARDYFWKNSIDVSALEKAIVKLQEQFSQ